MDSGIKWLLIVSVIIGVILFISQRDSDNETLSNSGSTTGQVTNNINTQNWGDGYNNDEVILEGIWKVELDNRGTSVTLKVDRDKSICSNCYGKYLYHSEYTDKYESGTVITENDEYVFGDLQGSMMYNVQFRGDINSDGKFRMNNGLKLTKMNN